MGPRSSDRSLRLDNLVSNPDGSVLQWVRGHPIAVYITSTFGLSATMTCFNGSAGRMPGYPTQTLSAGNGECYFNGSAVIRPRFMMESSSIGER
jgi:hypothetical protein